MAHYFTQTNAHAFVFLTLVVLQEHAYALPAPWPLLIDAVVQVADEQRAHLNVRQLPKFGDIGGPVGDALNKTPLGDQEINTPQGVASDMILDEAKKAANNQHAAADEDARPANPEPKSDQQQSESKPDKQEDKEKPGPKPDGDGQKQEAKGDASTLPGGTIAGISLGAILGTLFFIVAVVAGICLWRRRKPNLEDVDGDDESQKE